MKRREKKVGLAALPNRIRWRLEYYHGITTVDALIRLPIYTLLTMRGIGRQSLYDLVDFLVKQPQTFPSFPTTTVQQAQKGE